MHLKEMYDVPVRTWIFTFMCIDPTSTSQRGRGGKRCLRFLIGVKDLSEEKF